MGKGESEDLVLYYFFGIEVVEWRILREGGVDEGGLGTSAEKDGVLSFVPST